jgi:hypothetical protein
MWQTLAEMGVIESDRRTWDRPLSKMNRVARHPCFAEIASPRLCSAIDQLIGIGRWSVPASWGACLVTFPELRGGSWVPIEDGWHHDSWPNITNSGVQVLCVLATLPPTCGGTVFVAGSHRLLSQFFSKLSGEEQQLPMAILRPRFMASHPWLNRLGCKRPETDPVLRCRDLMGKSEFVQEGIELQVIETTGNPGDIILVHPLVLHATSYNRGSVPRLMRAKNLGMGPSTASGTVLPLNLIERAVVGFGGRQ